MASQKLEHKQVATAIHPDLERLKGNKARLKKKTQQHIIHIYLSLRIFVLCSTFSFPIFCNSKPKLVVTAPKVPVLCKYRWWGKVLIV